MLVVKDNVDNFGFSIKKKLFQRLRFIIPEVLLFYKVFISVAVASDLYNISELSILGNLHKGLVVVLGYTIFIFKFWAGLRLYFS